MDNNIIFSLFATTIERANGISSSDWINFTSQVLVAPIVAGIVTLAIQNHLRKKEERKNLIDEIHRFNEAAVYLAAFLENTASHINFLIFESYQNEKKYIADLKNLLEEKSSFVRQEKWTKIHTISPLKFEVEKFSRNIPDILNSDPCIFQNLLRLDYHICSFQELAEERTRIANSISGIQEFSVDNSNIVFEEKLYHQEMLFDRTEKLLINSFWGCTR